MDRRAPREAGTEDLMEPPIEQRLGKAWALYAKNVLAGASEALRNEIRRSFYAGAMSYHTILLASMTLDDNVQPEEAAVVEKLEREMDAFLADLREGRA